ncbi:hypothetical protein MMC28_008161 [Mycoblastus sanguinarius]|nr:hypothetical protein [Mycoblastus sanguinarius]
MKLEYSELVIRECILPDTDVPLFAACSGLLMMILHAGMERTEPQRRKLLHDVGLEVVGIWAAVRDGEGVIEAKKRLPEREQLLGAVDEGVKTSRDTKLEGERPMEGFEEGVIEVVENAQTGGEEAN